MTDYIQDFVKIRRGTDPKTAFEKSMRILWDYFLSESKDFKIQRTITINLQAEPEADNDNQ